MSALRVGTRASALAMAQTRWAVASLASSGVEVQIVTVSTEGDRSNAPLAQIGGTGVFTSALREALQDERIDVAVHSYKDLPTAPLAAVTVAAVPTREDPRDALVARDGLTLGELPPGSRIGTGSPRRAAQLRALGLDLQIEPLRGNIDTRVRAVTSARLDGVVLALAGLRRLGLDDRVTEVMDPLMMLPAPAQGALALECRTEDVGTRAVLAPLDDPGARAAVAAERSLLIALEAGCSSPVGGLAEIAQGDLTDEIYLRGSVTAPDGSDAVRLSATGPTPDAEAVGRSLAADLLAAGANTMMERSS